MRDNKLISSVRQNNDCPEATDGGRRRGGRDEMMIVTTG